MKAQLLIYTFCSILINTFLGEINAQTYNMSDDFVTDCSGTLYDSGGAGASYSSNENATFQICPDDPDNGCVSMSFNFFNLEASFDFLYIYDGDETTGTLLGAYSSTSPTSVISTNGCLTLVFDSDNGGNDPGWEAIWSCIPCPIPCGQEVCNGTPPANDACPNATNIGTLPPPIPCFTGNANQGNGDPIILNALTNLCATAEEPYNYIAGCFGAAAMASPAADVWYQMEVTGTALDVTITNGMPNTSLGLWYDNGGGCGSLAAAGCAVGDGNNLQASFLPLNPGIYYLQISGGDEEEQCSFNLTLQNNFDCEACLTVQNFEVSPPPTDGVYEAGSTVEFCYTVSEYNQTNINWMHAVVPEFGEGWDITTLQPSSTPNACDSNGNWVWYEGTVTGTGTGGTAGTGFYFEVNNPAGNNPNYPGDNYGDALVGFGNCSLTFCWEISAINSSNGESLSVEVETYADSETGAYNSLACQNDPSFTFNANLVNCFLPVASNIPDPTICEGDNITITASGTNDIVGYQWPAEAGGGTSPTVTLSPLTTTEYTLTVTNFCDEIDTETFTVNVIRVDASATTQTAFCDNSPTGSITVTATDGIEPYSYAWSDASFGDTSNPTDILPNTYTVTVTDDIGCTATLDVTVDSDTDLAATATATDVLCFNTNTGTATANATNGGGNYTYLWNDADAQTTQTAIDLPAGDYTVTVTDANTCETTASVSVVNATEMTSTISATDAGCDGSTSGTIDLNVVGGTGNYTFAWDNGLPSQEDHNAGILGGIYNVTITDENNCQITNSVEVTVPTPMQISITATDALCNGTATGTLNVSITGGTLPLTYAWSNGLTAQATHNNVAAGTYTVTVTDGDGCDVTENATVGEPTLLEIASLNAVDVACNGDSSGSIDLNVVGGTGNYTFEWNNGLGNDEDPQNVAMGDYAVTVTDENSCEVQGTISIGEPTALSIQIDFTDVLCNGQSDGTITVTTSGGTGNYTYAWNNGITQTSAFVDNLDVGTYEVTVSDQNNCTITANATIDEPVFMLASIQTEDASCEGQTDGSLNLNVSGGTSPYTYAWDNNLPTEQDHDNVAAGDYSVLVTDVNGCTVLGFGTVNAPEGLTLETTSVDVPCNAASTGSIDLTVTGGEEPYNYVWDNNLPPQQDHTFSLAAGTYSVTVSDVNGCQNTTSLEIFEPEAIVIELTATDITCNGANDGMIETVVTGGDFPYNFEWLPNLGNQPIHNGLAAGTYNVTVTDNNDCTNTASISITEPNAMTSTTQTTDATCGQSDGSATVTPNGGATPYTYNWNTTPPQTAATANNLSAGNYNVTITDNSNCFIVETVNISDAGGPTATTNFNNPTCGNANGDATITVSGGDGNYTYAWNTTPPQNDATANNLVAGTYNVTVTDGNGCVVSESFTLTDNGVPNASISTTETSCGQNNGTATVTVNSGGTPNYSFLWDANANNQTMPTATNLAVGTYSVTISDANSCETIETATITAGQSTVTTTSSTPASCGQNNGSATITVDSGVPSFFYLWDANANNQTSSTANNLAAGDYTVTLTDGDSCETVETITVANNGAIPNITMSATNASCGQNNGTATATVVQDFPPYQYEWNDANNQFAETATNLAAGNYEVTVTDVNGCENTATVTVGNDGETTISIINIVPTTCGENNGSAEVEINGTATPYDISWNDANNQTTAIATNLAAGDYEVTVTDANACENIETVTIATSEAIDANITITNSSCGSSNGQAEITVTNGAGNYTYEWGANANNQTTAIATNLAAGAYPFTITDADNCSFTDVANVTDEGGPTASISIDNEPTCENANGSATVTANGGQAPLTYFWSDTNNQTTATATNLAAGNYTVTVEDANNCVVTANITLTDAGLPTATATTTAATCGLANGEATITASDGGGNYTYLWNDANAQTTATATDLAAGTYEPTITDANNCSITIEVMIDDIAGVSLSLTATDANCGQANGTITATSSGGTAPFIYQWTSSGNDTDVEENLVAGSYTVTVTDANNCTAEATATINDIGGPTTSISATEATCGQENGTATISIDSGGQAPFTYLWNDANGQTTETAINLPAGQVSCTITDNNACTSTATTVVPSSNAPILDISATTANCGQDDGTATVTITSGGQTPFSYLWNDANGQTTETAINLPAGNYTVTVTDATLCAVTANIEVTSTDALQIDISATQDFCGQALATATATPLNGQAPYTYLWNDASSQTTEIATALIANNYTVTVTDANGCETTASIEVTEVAAPTANITNTTDASCGQTDGTATVTASGGGSTYTYLWDANANDQITATATDLAAGTYSVTVTDENNCSAAATANVSNLDAPTISIASTDTDCGVANGTATITASGGVEPYTYLWSNDSTTAVIDNLLPDTYTVTLTDANDCEAVESVTINGNIATPAPICFEQTSSSITVVWENVLGAEGYEVEINGNTQTVVDTFFVVENLAQEETVTLNILANGGLACGLSATAIVSCTTTAENCPPADAIFDNLDMVYCVEDTAFELAATPAGGIFSIDSVANTSFNPQAIGSGQHEVTYSFTDENNCLFTASQTVEISAVSASISPATITIEPSNAATLTVNANSALGNTIQYLWSDSTSLDCTDCETVTATPNENTTYTVLVADEYGCVDNATAIVAVVANNTVAIPTAFTPNGDGQNDEFRVIGSNISEVELSIFNRWGNELFTTTDISQAWNGQKDGRDVELGVYVYYAKIIFTDKSEEFFKGNVTLIR